MNSLYDLFEIPIGFTETTLETVPDCDLNRYGGLWYVIACKPTLVETWACNAIERYTISGKNVQIDFSFKNNTNENAHVFSVPQRGFVQTSTKWKISPFWPIVMPYMIIDLDTENYEYVVIGYPSREYCWIMCRAPTMDGELYTRLIDRLQTVHKYDLTGLRKIPQIWSEKEQCARLTDVEIKFLAM
jgi:apolipoprotein D and lipocalin family protein